MAKILNLQDSFLNQVRIQQVPVNIFFINGQVLRGLIKGFDNYSIILEDAGKQQFVYKHMISTVFPLRFKMNIKEGTKPGIT